MSPIPEDNLPDGSKRSPLDMPQRVGDADTKRTIMIWDRVQRNIHKAHGPHRPSYLGEMALCTAILPYHWNRFPPDLTKYLQQELFDVTMTAVLEAVGMLNASRSIVQLFPLSTTGDGNCLLHALSLAMWGVEDSDMRLRKLLHSVMKGEFAADKESRWRRERNRFDSEHIPGSGFRYNTREWSEEWRIVVDISSPERRTDQTVGLPYECLEEFHIFLMANILRRPIIVLAEDMWHDAAGHSLQPLNYCGIYLPLAWEPKDCCPYPLVLGYHHMHFTPLVCTAPVPGTLNRDEYVVPLQYSWESKPLSVHFLTEEEDAHEDALLEAYLQLKVLELEIGEVRCARLATEQTREEMDVFGPYLRLAEARYRLYVEEEHNPENAGLLKAAGMMSARNSQQLNERLATASVMKPSEDVPNAPVTDQLRGYDLRISRPVSSQGHTQNSLELKESAALPGVEPHFRVQSSSSGQVHVACATPRCRYFAAAASEPYCSECYQRSRSNVKDELVKCLTKLCLNGGEREYRGLCKVCFEQSNFMSSDALPFLPPSEPGSYVEELRARGPVMPELTGDLDEEGENVEGLMSPQHALNTNVINAFEVGSKKCRITSCDFTGNPKFSGMCSRCYKEKESTPAPSNMTLSSVEAGETGLVAGLLSESAHKQIQKCLVPECQLTGRPDKNNLCSGCFRRQAELLDQTNKAGAMTINLNGDKDVDDETSNHSAIPDSPSRYSVKRQQVLWENVRPAKCRDPRCEMFTHQSQDGFCSRCFKKARASGPSAQSRGKIESLKENPNVHCKPSSRKPLDFTVKKNMCATPGCNGVRVQLGDGDLCFTHYKNRSTLYSQLQHSAPSTQTATSSTVERARPSAPPQSVVSYQAQIPPAALGSRTKGGPASPPLLCSHPKCDNPAMPPHNVACLECMRFVEKIHGIHEAISSMQKVEKAGKHGTSIPSPIQDETRVETPPKQDSDDMLVENLKNFDVMEKVSPGLSKKFQFDHVKRGPCQATGGCPEGLHGDPSFGNMCSQCFARQKSKKFVSRTAPQKRTPPKPSVPALSQSAIVSTRAAPRPSNFRKCITTKCSNQANPEVLEGFCNKCFPVYRSSTGGRPAEATPKPQLRSPSGVKSAGGARKVVSDGELYETAVGSKVPKCKSRGCDNFGNTQCHGFCNDCFHK